MCGACRAAAFGAMKVPRFDRSQSESPILRVLALGLVMMAGAEAVCAQTMTRFVLPGLMPRAFEGEPIADSRAIAFMGDGAIHVIDGLPLTANYRRPLMPLGLSPASTWTALSADRVIYRGGGTTTDPADDRLVLLTDLPHNPRFLTVPTVGDVRPDFIALQDHVAVRLAADGRGLDVLTHDAAGGFIDPYSSSLLLGVPQAGFALGRLSDDAIGGLAPGADSMRGTPDDLFFVIDRIDQALVRTPRVRTFGLPAAFRPDCVVALTDGSVLVVDHEQDVFKLRHHRLDAAGNLQTRILTHDFNSGGTVFQPRVTAGPEGSFVLAVDRDGKETAQALFTTAFGSISLLQQWTNFHATGVSSTQVGPTQVLEIDSSLTSGGYRLIDYAFGGSPIVSRRFDWRAAPQGAMPFPGALVVRANLAANGPFGLDRARAEIVHGTLGPNPGVTSFEFFGQWAGDAASALAPYGGVSPLVPLGFGRAAAFVSTGGDEAAEFLNLFTVPARERIGSGQDDPAAQRIQLGLPGLLPGEAVSGGGGLEVTLDAGLGPNFLVFWGVTPEARGGVAAPVSVFAPGSRLHLDPTGILGFLPFIDLGPGVDVPITLDPVTRATLTGTPLYLQVAAPDALSVWHVSDAQAIVLR